MAKTLGEMVQAKTRAVAEVIIVIAIIFINSIIVTIFNFHQLVFLLIDKSLDFLSLFLSVNSPYHKTKQTLLN